MNQVDSKIIDYVAAKNGIGSPFTLEKYTSGQINRVYNLDNKYALKIEGEYDFVQNVLPYQSSIIEKLINKGAKVPKILDAGKVEGKNYLLMEKVSGESLVYLWPELPNAEKEDYIRQLCEQLKVFHSIKSYSYGKTYRGWNFDNFKDAVKAAADFSKIDQATLEPEDLENLEMLQNYYQENLDVTNEQNTGVLVHNDIHFENILVADNKITGIIDWDWAWYAPKDYELRKILLFVNRPADYVEKKLELLFPAQLLFEELSFFKKHYPELFKVVNLKERIRLYNIELIMDKLEEVQKGIWSRKALLNLRQIIDDFYKNDWLERALTI